MGLGLGPVVRHRLVELVHVQIGPGDAAIRVRKGAAGGLCHRVIVAEEVEEAIADRLCITHPGPASCLREAAGVYHARRDGIDLYRVRTRGWD